MSYKIVIETMKDANKIFYAPIQSDLEPGCRFEHYSAMHFFGSDYDSSVRYIVKFNNIYLENYWENMEKSLPYRKLVTFNFDTGQNGDRSWWGYDENCILRENSTEEIKAYNKVAKKISKFGYYHFTFKVYEDIERCTRTILVTDKSTKQSFNIDDIVDPNLYDDLLNWINLCDDKEKEINIVDSANNFLC